MTITKQQIGKCGELLVQYKFLKNGIESAHLTTDAGIDLVAYFPKNKKPITIQVKTNLQAKRAGGKGKKALDWWFPKDSPAEMVALVDIESFSVWLLKKTELNTLEELQQSKGKYHIGMYVDPAAKPRRKNRLRKDFNQYLLEKRLLEIF